MDPMSIISNIGAVVKLNGDIINYIKDMRGAPQERFNLAVEMSALNALLTVLHRRVRDANSGDPWFTAIRTLAIEHGPLHQFKASLVRLESKLDAAHPIGRIGRRVTWSFEKPEIRAILDEIGRVKASVSLAFANDHFRLSQAIQGGVVDITSRVAELQVNVNDEERRNIVDWLSPLDFKVFQGEVLEKRVAGTGQWMLESEQFINWRDGASETLWCPGPPGAGKTVIASIVVNHLQMIPNNDNTAVLSIYCNYQQTEQTVSKFIASLLKQLVQGCHAVSHNIKSFYNHHHGQGVYPTLGQYTEALQSEIAIYSKVFIVVDALDECTENNGTRAELLQVLQSLASTVKLMVTSRTVSAIARDFQGINCLHINAKDQDIQRYIEVRIPREPRLARLVKAKPASQKAIINKIISNVDGMFLLAHLHMDSLARKINAAAVYTALDNLPKKVDNAYRKAMEQIEEQSVEDRDLAKKVLTWVAFAEEPLFVKELQHALMVHSGMTDMESDAIINEDVLTSVCAGLVVIDEKHGTIHLVHSTAQQYFKLNPLFPNVQSIITATCLIYLSFDEFEKMGFCNDDEALESLQHDYPFLRYAAYHWGHHARKSAQETSKDIALKFLQNNKKVACASQVLLTRGHHFEGYSQWVAKGFTGMHLAAFFGLEKVMLESGADVDIKDSHSRTPLSLAAERGNGAVVELLVAQENVDVNSMNKWKKTPLSLAAGKGHKEVVKLLVAVKGIDVNVKDRNGKTPLALASENGQEAVVKMLMVTSNVAVNVMDKLDATPLWLAAEKGYEAVVKILLTANGIKLDTKNKYGMSPLAIAADGGHVAVVNLLIKRSGIDINSKNYFGQTPLSLATQKGHTAVVELLQGRTMDDNGNKTPLTLAAENGHEDQVAELLLKQDNVNMKDMRGITPLIIAAEKGHEGVVNQLLRQPGIDVNLKGPLDDSPLRMAALNGHEAVVKLLLARDDILVNAQNALGGTPLRSAARRGHDAVVKLLLQHGSIDVNLRNDEGKTALALAAQNGHEISVELLMETDGIDINSEDEEGQTPRALAVERGNEAVVNLLTAHINNQWRMNSRNQYT